MKRSEKQNKELHRYLADLGISKENKAALVGSYTNKRTFSSAKMEYKECAEIIAYLKTEYLKLHEHKRESQEILQKSRREVFKLCYDLGFINATMSNEEKLAVINAWIIKKQNLALTLNQLDVDALVKLIKQLKTVRRIYMEKQTKNVNLN